MLDKKLDEYVTRVENDAYELGISVGKSQERRRIVDLLESIAYKDEDGDEMIGEFKSDLIALIKGETHE
jgi:low affinity Fe/Cu permease